MLSPRVPYCKVTRLHNSGQVAVIHSLGASFQSICYVSQPYDKHTHTHTHPLRQQQYQASSLIYLCVSQQLEDKAGKCHPCPGATRKLTNSQRQITRSFIISHVLKSHYLAIQIQQHAQAGAINSTSRKLLKEQPPHQRQHA